MAGSGERRGGDTRVRYNFSWGGVLDFELAWEDLRVEKPETRLLPLEPLGSRVDTGYGWEA